MDFRLEIHNKGGHSSLPVADNAIYHLAGALDRLAHFGLPLKTNEVTKAYFAEMAKLETRRIKQDLAAIASGSQIAMEHVAEAISDNRGHFPSASLSPWKLQCLTADAFLVDPYRLDPAAFIAVITEQAADIKWTLPQLLSKHVPSLSQLIKIKD